MGAGRSIAVQNFNENFSILVLGTAYSLSAGLGDQHRVDDQPAVGAQRAGPHAAPGCGPALAA